MRDNVIKTNHMAVIWHWCKLGLSWRKDVVPPPFEKYHKVHYKDSVCKILQVDTRIHTSMTESMHFILHDDELMAKHVNFGFEHCLQTIAYWNRTVRHEWNILYFISSHWHTNQGSYRYVRQVKTFKQLNSFACSCLDPFNHVHIFHFIFQAVPYDTPHALNKTTYRHSIVHNPWHSSLHHLPFNHNFVRYIYFIILTCTSYHTSTERRDNIFLENINNNSSLGLNALICIFIQKL